MPTTTSVVVWIGVLFLGDYSDYKEFYYTLPEEVRENLDQGQWYEVDGLTFREFEFPAEATVGLGVEYHRHYWSDGVGSFEDLFSKKGEIAQMKEKVKKVMQEWGVKKNVGLYYQVDPDD